MRHESFINESLAYLVSFVLIFALGVTALRCFRYANRFFVVPAEQLLAQDDRAPVLYLRPFEFEAVSTKATKVKTGTMPLMPVSFSLPLDSYEEVLAKVLSRIGPCITVGLPNLEQRIPGFSRIQLSGDEWQSAVDKMMESAALVVICTGETPGIAWEFFRAAELVPRERLVILVTSTTTDEWWQKADEVLGIKLPRISSYSKDILNGIVYFDAGGKPHFDTLISTNQPPAAIKKALEVVLKPVFANYKNADMNL